MCPLIVFITKLTDVLSVALVTQGTNRIKHFLIKTQQLIIHNQRYFIHLNALLSKNVFLYCTSMEKNSDEEITDSTHTVFEQYLLILTVKYTVVNNTRV